MNDYSDPGSARGGQQSHGDLVIGVASRNNASVIADTVRATHHAMTERFPGLQVVMVNVDAGSTDGTPDLATDAAAAAGASLVSLVRPRHQVQHLAESPQGPRITAGVLREVLALSRSLGARATVMLDAAVPLSGPDLLDVLVMPVIEFGFDYVAPAHLRQKHEAVLAGAFAYPLTRALYGARVRQPLGTEVAMSAAFGCHCLDTGSFDDRIPAEALGLWLTTSAVCGGFRACQGFLGARTLPPRDSLATGAGEVWEGLALTAFELMDRHQGVWTLQARSEEIPAIGTRFGVVLGEMSIDPAAMRRRFLSSVATLDGVWSGFLNDGDLGRVREMAHVDAPDTFDDRLWARLVYDLAVAHQRRVMDRRHLVRSFLPLVIGWGAGFVMDLRNADALGVHDRVERVAAAFEAERPHLDARWPQGN